MTREVELQEPLCAKCARYQRTCCQDTEIYVTVGDIRRIVAHVGREDFFEMRTPEDPTYRDQDDDPVWRDHVLRPDGTRRVLKWAEGRNCTFLGEQGCRLPLEIRPLVCRLYPYDYTADGIHLEPASGCPLHFVAAGAGLFETLRMDVEDARRWHGQLYEEMKQESCSITT